MPEHCEVFHDRACTACDCRKMTLELTHWQDGSGISSENFDLSSLGSDQVEEILAFVRERVSC